MGKNEKTPIIIDDVEYQYEDMTEEQQLYVNHISDLDRKLSSARFNVDQLEVGKSAFIKMLTDSLIVENEEVSSIEANVTSQLNALENPTEGSGTPWAA